MNTSPSWSYSSFTELFNLVSGYPLWLVHHSLETVMSSSLCPHGPFFPSLEADIICHGAVGGLLHLCVMLMFGTSQSSKSIVLAF